MKVGNQSVSCFTAQEITAFYDTKKLLLSQGMDVEKMERITLFLCVMICKLRPDKAATKYTKWLGAINEFGVNSFQEVFKDILFHDDEDENVKVNDAQDSTKVGENISNNQILQNNFINTESSLNGENKIISRNKYEASQQEWLKLLPHFDRFAGAGLDNHQRSIMWIRAGPCPPEDERTSACAGVLIWAAVHADLISMRNGITFVIDTDLHDLTEKYGNERKLLKYRQFIPLRPQKIYILGAGYFKRVIINAALAFASFFQSEKISDRICFADLNDVRKEVSDESMPVYITSPLPSDTSSSLPSDVNTSSPDYADDEDDSAMKVAVTETRKPTLGGGRGIITSEDFMKWTKMRLRQLIDMLPPFDV